MTKFLKSVNWSVNKEVEAALELLYKWKPLAAVDSLELLSRTFQSTHPAVRKYAVTCLMQADDEVIVCGFVYTKFHDTKKQTTVCMCVYLRVIVSRGRSCYSTYCNWYKR